MSRLLRIFFTALSVVPMVLLSAGTAYADETETANRIIEQANVMQKNVNTLDRRATEIFDEAFAIDPVSARGSDALPLLTEAKDVIAQMSDLKGEIAALLGRIARLDVSEEYKTYASQQVEIAETYREAYTATTGLIADYEVVYDADRLGALSEAELDALDAEMLALADRSDELLTRITEMEEASDEYHADHSVGQVAAQGRGAGAWVISLVVASGFAVLCGVLAGRKNRNVIGWGILGFVAPIIGVLAVLAVKKVEPTVVPPAAGTARASVPVEPAGASREGAASVMPPPPDPATAVPPAAAPAPPEPAAPAPPAEAPASAADQKDEAPSVEAADQVDEAPSVEAADQVDEAPSVEAPSPPSPPV